MRSSRALALAMGLAAATALSSQAMAATQIDFMFPAAVQGKLAREMQAIVKDFNDSQSEVEVTGVFAGSYDETKIKSQAAAQAGRPPAVVLMSANFVTELWMNDQITPVADYMKKAGVDPKAFIDEFWPAVRPNATIDGTLYAIPFQNSTPILYYNKDQFKEAGITRPPETWSEWVADAKKLTRPGGKRWGLMMPSNYDYNGWLVQTLAMSNGSQFFNLAYPGEVYYDTPSTRGALKFWRDLAHVDKVMPTGVTSSKQVSTAFFSGQASMIVLSTGALSFVRENAKFDYGVAFIPRNVRNAVPIGGASLVSFKGLSEAQQQAAWTFMAYLSSPEILGRWSRFTGYFAPRRTAYDLPEMQDFVKQHPDALRAVQQLEHAQPWLATYNTVAVRKAVEDQMQALLSDPDLPVAEAVRKAQAKADEIMRPYVEKTADGLM
ncbi:MAG TPA: ABC transporter substrate-binding protein [Alphaproteobacteria bacterium]|jgi:sn-glycerol 3-phosphate transport system substrate-binding protein|nr:ABC transporter substrate-binding protein [Alphaproteobacteria bacterium]